LEDPEGRWTELEEVMKLAEDRDPEVARLGALSAVLVFKDICPGYRIRALTEKELLMKVTKETQKLRDFEAGLLKMYKGFVRLITRRGGGEKKSRAQRGGGFGLNPGVALTCLCQLLAALPHFNFRTDVLSALVPHMARVDAAAADVVADAVAGAIKADLAGDLTLEALQMTAQLVKQTKCGAHPRALSPFLEIRFDEGALALEARKKPEVLSRKQTKKKRAEEREMIRKGRAEKARKQADKERLKRFGHVDDDDDASEDEANEETQLDRDMEEGAGRLDNAKKRKLQSKMLEATFEMYFRVLKNAAGPEPARGIPLMTPALVGLGKFTHLISVTFMADLMEVFRRLLKGDSLSADQKARCLLTACEITSGHGEALQVDAGEFHRQLYAMLGEASVGTSGWGSSLDGTQSSSKTDDDDQHSMLSHPVHAASDDALDRGTLRVRALQKFLAAQKQVDQNRVAAFAKRLASAALAAEAGRGGWRPRRREATARRVPSGAMFAGERARRHGGLRPEKRRPRNRGGARGCALGSTDHREPLPPGGASRRQGSRHHAARRRRGAGAGESRAERTRQAAQYDARELQACDSPPARAQKSKALAAGPSRRARRGEPRRDVSNRGGP
jgi:nucleolar complex protein 3